MNYVKPPPLGSASCFTNVSIGVSISVRVTAITEATPAEIFWEACFVP